MKTQKTWIKLSLTNLEKENLENHAKLNKITDSQMINKLILSMINEPFNNMRILDKGETTTAFNINNELIEILEKYSNEYKLSKNKILRYLIADLPIIESQENKENNNEKMITTRIDLESRTELKILVAENSTNSSLLVRQIFDQVDLISIKNRDYELDTKLSINVSEKFKKSFTKKAKELEISNSELLRNIIYSILGK